MSDVVEHLGQEVILEEEETGYASLPRVFAQTFGVLAIAVVAENAPAQMPMPPPPQTKEARDGMNEGMVPYPQAYHAWIREQTGKISLLLPQLDHDRYPVRERATVALEAIVRDVIAKMNPPPAAVVAALNPARAVSLDQRKRLERVNDVFGSQPQESTTRVALFEKADAVGALEKLSQLSYTSIRCATPEVAAKVRTVELDPARNSFVQVLAQVCEKAKLVPSRSRKDSTVITLVEQGQGAEYAFVVDSGGGFLLGTYGKAKGDGTSTFDILSDPQIALIQVEAGESGHAGPLAIGLTPIESWKTGDKVQKPKSGVRATKAKMSEKTLEVRAGILRLPRMVTAPLRQSVTLADYTAYADEEKDTGAIILDLTPPSRDIPTVYWCEAEAQALSQFAVLDTHGKPIAATAEFIYAPQGDHAYRVKFTPRKGEPAAAAVRLRAYGEIPDWKFAASERGQVFDFTLP